VYGLTLAKALMLQDRRNAAASNQLPLWFVLNTDVQDSISLLISICLITSHDRYLLAHASLGKRGVPFKEPLHLFYWAPVSGTKKIW